MSSDSGSDFINYLDVCVCVLSRIDVPFPLVDLIYHARPSVSLSTSSSRQNHPLEN